MITVAFVFKSVNFVGERYKSIREQFDSVPIDLFLKITTKKFLQSAIHQ
jgi:hypothetical protein